jgi:hypothetical protein
MPARDETRKPSHAADDDGHQQPGQHRPPGPDQEEPDRAAAHAAGGQQRAHRVLGELLEAAAAHGLPGIDWTIAADGTRLTGRCTAYTAPGRRRADFEAWRALLGADTSEGSADGQTARLTAIAQRDNGLVSIEIIADLYDDLGTPFSAPTAQHAWRSP